VIHQPSARWATVVLATAVAVGGAASLASGQDGSRPASGPTAGDRFKNVLVLKDLPADQLHDAMVFMSAAVGGNCGTCHSRGAGGEMTFEKDDNRNKTAARAMIQMVRAINLQHFQGEDRVTCATCHQARREPSPVAPLSQLLTADQLAALADRNAPRPGGVAPGQPAGAGQPGRGSASGPGAGGPQRPTETVDQVLEKYVKALGGSDALARLASRVRRGTLANRAGQTFPVAIEETAAGLFRMTLGSAPAMSRAFDGKAAWADSGGRTRGLEGVEAASVALPADLQLGSRLREQYSALAVRAYDRVNGKAVIVMEGRRSPAVSETFYFDRDSGLLVRRAARLRTALGSVPVQIDYDDYRPVDGVLTPFEVRITDWESVSIETFTEVTHNQPIDAARFARPAAAPGR
jgi:hypothetical protein